MIRARDKLVTLLDGIISEERPNRIPDPHPILLTLLLEREFTTPRLSFYHGLLGSVVSTTRFLR
jgi:hypothetical protein